MINTILNLVSIIIGALIVLLVVLQAKSSGFSTVFGGGSFQTTRRGGEKVLHYITVLLVCVFCLFSLARILVF